MPSLARWLFAAVAVASSILPGRAAAEPRADPAQAAPLTTVDQARGAFYGAGYTVDQPYAWDWTYPPVTTFEVHGRGDGRVVMVLVYPSMTAADAARLLADSHEQALNAGLPVRSDGGPHLVTGFGESTWNGNVALVQSTDEQLALAYQSQVALDHAHISDALLSDDPGMPATAVDLDFLQALRSGVVTL